MTLISSIRAKQKRIKQLPVLAIILFGTIQSVHISTMLIYPMAYTHKWLNESG